MNLGAHESRFLSLLEAKNVNDGALSRTEHGHLLVSFESPCEEIGALWVYIAEEGVTLSCRVSHSHVNASQSTDGDFLNLAAERVRAFLSDQLAVCRQLSPNGDEIASGWSPVDAIGSRNPEYEAFIAEQYGGPMQTVYWFWSGRRVAL